MSEKIYLDSEPNYQVALFKEHLDTNPAVFCVQENSESDALERVISELKSRNLADSYARTDFATADGTPEHPEDYIETSCGWVWAEYVRIDKISDKVFTVMTPNCAIEFLQNNTRDGLNEDYVTTIANFMLELADYHLNPFTCKAIQYNGNDWEYNATETLCTYKEF